MRKTFHRFVQVIAVTLSALLFQSTLTLPLAEAGFWEERQKATRDFREKDLVLAALPMSLPTVGFAPQAVTTPASSTPYQNLSIPARLGRLMEIPGEASSKRVIILQDAHRIYSAQLMLSKLLSHLAKSDPHLFVGVEGAAGPFALADLQRWTDVDEMDTVSRYLLEQNFINGSELFGITHPQGPTLWGIENPSLYQEHVNVLKEGLAQQSALQTQIKAIKSKLAQQKSSGLTQKVRDWDQTVEFYHDGRMSFPQYVQGLTEGIRGPLPTEIKKLLHVLRWEKETRLPRVEMERRRALEELTARLSPASLREFMDETTAFRLGELSGAEFYGRWEKRAGNVGLSWNQFPQLELYAKTVALVESIDAAALFAEAQALEETTEKQMTVSAEERNILSLSRNLRQLERLVSFNLLPSEWAQVKAQKKDWFEVLQRGAVGSGLSENFINTLLPFARFYELADERNGVMVDNLVEKAESSKARVIALVVGGFHTSGLKEELRKRGWSTVVISPQMGDVVSGTSYLDAFTVNRTPLERLLLGEKLDLSPPARLAVTPLGSENSGAIVRGSMVARVALKLSQGAEDVVAWARTQNIPAQVRSKQSAEVEFPEGEATVTLTEKDQPEGSPQITLIDKTGDTVTAVVSFKANRSPLRWLRQILSRFSPEMAAGIFLLATDWGGEVVAMIPGLNAGGVFGLGVVLLGFVFRAGWMGSIYAHGSGHLVGMGTPWSPMFPSLKTYHPASLWTLLAGGLIFIPGLAARPPTLTLPPGTSPARVRIISGLGLGVSFGLMLLSSSLVFSGVLTGTWGWISLVFSVMNGLHLFSPTDWQGLLTGRTDKLNCGVIGIIDGSKRGDVTLLNEDIKTLAQVATDRTLHRGGQSGGYGLVAQTVNGVRQISFLINKVDKKRDRRSRLEGKMTRALDDVEQRGKSRGMASFARRVLIGHTRYGTNLASPEATNAHPHASPAKADSLYYVGQKSIEAKYEKFWSAPTRQVDAALKRTVTQRQVAIAHNGDDNATLVRTAGGESWYMENDQDARVTERLEAWKNPAVGDSPQIATRLERWITQGSLKASLQLALLTVAFASLPLSKVQAGTQALVPTPEIVDSFLKVDYFSEGGMGHHFSQDVAHLQKSQPEATNLRDLFFKSGALAPQGMPRESWVPELEEPVVLAEGSAIAGLRTSVLHLMPGMLSHLDWYSDLDKESKVKAQNLLADLFLKFFFTGDFESAGIHLLKRADPTSTYGLMATTLLEPEHALFACHLQPFYLWLTNDGLSLAGSSESTAFLGQSIGASPLRYRLTLKNGDVAYYTGHQLVITNVLNSSRKVFDLTKPDSVVTEGAWIDTTQAAKLPRPSDQPVDLKSRVDQDIALIPRVNQVIQEDMENPASFNAQSTAALRAMLDKRLRRKNRSGMDLVIVGTQKSFDSAEMMRDLLTELYSQAGTPIRIEVLNAPAFNPQTLKGLHERGFDENTPVLGMADSGQTANTLYVLDALHRVWHRRTQGLDAGGQSIPPPHFLMSAHMDNSYTENYIGQGLRDQDPFLARNFITFPGGLDPFHPDEVATVTHKAQERLIKEVALSLVRKRFEKKKTFSELRRLVSYGDELDRLVIGRDAQGNTYAKGRTGADNTIPAQLDSLAKKLNQVFTEGLWVAAATALFVLVTLLVHTTPASLLLGWIPQSAFLLSQGIPWVTLGLASAFTAGVAWKTRLWTWSPLLALLGFSVTFVSGVFAGELVTLGMDFFTGWVGLGSWATGLGALNLPLTLDESPTNLLNIASYVFFAFGFTTLLRRWQGRMWGDRMGSRPFVLVDSQEWNGRLNADRWRRWASLRYGWLGWSSIKTYAMADLTHRTGTIVRGTLFLQGVSVNDEPMATMNYKQLGGNPTGHGRPWRMGMGHRPADQVSPAFSEGYISLWTPETVLAGERSSQTLQELLAHAGARDTANIVLASKVMSRMLNIRPLQVLPGTSSQAKTSTTMQGNPPIDALDPVFGLWKPAEIVAPPAPASEPLAIQMKEESPAVEETPKQTPAPFTAAEEIELAALLQLSQKPTSPRGWKRMILNRGKQGVEIPAALSAPVLALLVSAESALSVDLGDGPVSYRAEKNQGLERGFSVTVNDGPSGRIILLKATGEAKEKDQPTNVFSFSSRVPPPSQPHTETSSPSRRVARGMGRVLRYAIFPLLILFPVLMLASDSDVKTPLAKGPVTSIMIPSPTQRTLVKPSEVTGVKKNGMATVMSLKGGKVNLRTGAGKNHAVIESLSPGTTLFVVDASKPWVKVSVEGNTGFILGKYLAPMPSPQPKPKGSPAATTPATQRALVSVSDQVHAQVEAFVAGLIAAQGKPSHAFSSATGGMGSPSSRSSQGRKNNSSGVRRSSSPRGGTSLSDFRSAQMSLLKDAGFDLSTPPTAEAVNLLMGKDVSFQSSNQLPSNVLPVINGLEGVDDRDFKTWIERLPLWLGSVPAGIPVVVLVNSPQQAKVLRKSFASLGVGEAKMKRITFKVARRVDSRGQEAVVLDETLAAYGALGLNQVYIYSPPSVLSWDYSGDSWSVSLVNLLTGGLAAVVPLSLQADREVKKALAQLRAA